MALQRVTPIGPNDVAGDTSLLRTFTWETDQRERVDGGARRVTRYLLKVGWADRWGSTQARDLSGQ
jgi:hypothetical protein